MTDTNVFQLSQPGNFADPLTEVLRKGARELLASAISSRIMTSSCATLPRSFATDWVAGPQPARSNRRRSKPLQRLARQQL